VRDFELEAQALRERLVRQGEDYLKLEAELRRLRDGVEAQAALDRASAEHWKWQYEFVTTSRSWQTILRLRRIRDRLRGLIP
jgi:hypothetical protein